MPNEDTWHMSPQVQTTTLVIVILVCCAIYVGARTLWSEWRKQWSIEDFIDGFISENADVLKEDGEHGCDMPRRPKVLGRLGWRG